MKFVQEGEKPDTSELVLARTEENPESQILLEAASYLVNSCNAFPGFKKSLIPQSVEALATVQPPEISDRNMRVVVFQHDCAKELAGFAMAVDAYKLALEQHEGLAWIAGESFMSSVGKLATDLHAESSKLSA